MEITLFGKYVDELNAFLAIGVMDNVVVILHLNKVKTYNGIVYMIMASPPASPPRPPPPPSSDASASSPPGVERLVVHIDPATGKADGPHRKKLKTYLGIVERDKAEFEILEASDTRMKKKLLQTVDERWRQFKSDLMRKWALVANQDGVDDAVCEKYDISKEKWAQFCQTRRDPSWEKQNTVPHALSRGGYEYLEQKLLAEKTKKKLEEATQSKSVDGVINPPSLVRRHVKWKMARTKKTKEMTTEAAKEIAKKIDSFEEHATQGSFVPRGHQDVLTAAIGRPEHPGRVRAARAGVTIRQYFRSAPRTPHSSSSLPPEELHSWQRSATCSPSFSPRCNLMDLHCLLSLWLVPQESCVDPSRNDPETGYSDRCGLYIEANPARLVALGRVYEGSTIVHNTPLLPGKVKVGMEEVKDPDAPVPIPTNEVSLVGQAIHTFLAWPTHLVKSLSQQAVVSPTKPPQKPNPEVDDPLYLITLTIPELLLRPYQVTLDATVFGVFNPDFLLYIKHEDLSKIAHGGQCLSISVLKLWILHLTKTCIRVGNSDFYGFLEPQSIRRSGQSQFETESYIKKFKMQCLPWSLPEWMVLIVPKEHLIVWFCSLHNRPDNYLKGIINSALKGLDDAPQPKSKAPARQKGSTECVYYVMHWMSTIILGSFRNNWEAYFNDPRPFEPERLKALQVQWAQYYLRVRAES
ncbi:hypothetical protein HKD37_01G001062 [Glycine soja]